MAESSDQADTSLQSSIYQGSRDDFEHSCGQCFDDGHDVEAHGFCIECREYLCINCFRAHRKNKASREHKLLGESELQNVQIVDLSSTICTDKCLVHTNEIVKFYCTSHDELCCNDCVVISHRHCQIDYIPDKCSEILESKEYQKALQAIDIAQQKVDSVKLVAKKAETETKTSNEAVLEDILTFEQELHDLLEKKRKTIELEATKIRKANQHTLNKIFDTCNVASSNLATFRKEILDCKETKSLAQLFIAIKKTAKALKAGEVSESLHMLRGITTRYHFERRADMGKIATSCFGTIKDGTQCVPFNLLEPKFVKKEFSYQRRAAMYTESAKCKAEVSLDNETDTIEVRNFADPGSDDTLQYYFENTKRSGGGEIVTFNIKRDKGFARIQFKDHSVVQRVLRKMHIVEKCKLSVCPLILSETELLLEEVPDTMTDKSLIYYLEAKIKVPVESVVFNQDRCKCLVQFKQEFGKFEIIITSDEI